MTKKIEKITQEELKDFPKAQRMHNDWELYENDQYQILCRPLYNSNNYEVAFIKEKSQGDENEH